MRWKVYLEPSAEIAYHLICIYLRIQNFVLLLIVRTILTLLVNPVAQLSHLPALSQCRCSFILAQHKPSCIIHFQDICEWIYYTIFIACTKNIKRFGNLIIHDVMSHFHSRYFQLPWNFFQKGNLIHYIYIKNKVPWSSHGNETKSATVLCFKPWK